MDSLTYYYNDKTNRLNHIRDNIAATNYTTDIDNQSLNNYAYDSIGNLTQVAADGVSDMTWTVYGKLKKAIGTGFTQQYVYDANNNRIIKIVQFGPIIGKQYFIRDAQGNVLAVYTYDGTSLKWAEQDLYGSSRVGLWGWNKTIPTRVMLPESETDTLTNWYLLGSRYYELTNHLGNVLSVITDKKIGLSLDDATIDHYSAEVLSQNDYYPFGMLEPGRNIRTIPYPYAFNGKRMENVELYTTNIYDYGMRSYDARIGRFYSVDPLTSKYPFYSPYQFAGNNPIKFVDLEGLEPGINQPTNNPELKGKEGRMWLVNKAFNLTGGENKFSASPITEMLGSYAPVVEKSRFIINRDKAGLNRTVNESSQFILTNENAFKTDKDLVNHLLGNFLWGIGPENYIFPENGKFSTELKNSIAVGETLVNWAKNNYEDKVYGWNMDTRGEINIDINSGFTSLEHFLGSVKVKISLVNDQTIKLEIFNVTSLTSGDINKDLFKGIVSPLKSIIRDGAKHTDHSNISEYFSLTMSTSEANKLIKQFNGGKLPERK